MKEWEKLHKDMDVLSYLGFGYSLLTTQFGKNILGFSNFDYFLKRKADYFKKQPPEIQEKIKRYEELTRKRENELRKK